MTAVHPGVPPQVHGPQWRPTLLHCPRNPICPLNHPPSSQVHDPMEEIGFGPSNWLWDYLRRSGMRGYFLPLSGGADSASTACLVAIMCQRLVAELQSGSARSKAKVRRRVPPRDPSGIAT
eukprot:2594862-Prymnesium_polylepis.1